ncbi:MAG TPA: hypothetical protein VK427_13985 [Kofleriaceae bacterium]|nr:hypothetical protein [Kofleriaceae bacterium]
MHNALALAVFVVAGCGPEKEDYKKQAPPAEPERPKEVAPPPKRAEVPTDLGKCTLTARGAVTAEQETPGGRAATNVSYWLTDEERKNMMGIDGFVITCQGEKIRFQIVPGGGKPDAMPFAPKKYEIKKGKGDATVSVGLGKATLAEPTGTIDITAFDARHIAGTVELTGKLQPGSGNVTLAGSFDLICPGFKGCKYD